MELRDLTKPTWRINGDFKISMEFVLSWVSRHTEFEMPEGFGGREGGMSRSYLDKPEAQDKDSVPGNYTQSGDAESSKVLDLCSCRCQGCTLYPAFDLFSLADDLDPLSRCAWLLGHSGSPS